jgi:N-acetylglucosamine malate deacetylase 2
LTTIIFIFEISIRADIANFKNALSCKPMAIDLMLIVAHPDDECYGTGGTFAEYAAKGLETGLITLTKGKSGRSLELCLQEDLPEFRAQELLESVKHLGIKHFSHYEYPDASPVSRAEQYVTSIPGTFVGGLQDVPRDEVVARVTKTLEELRPKVVMGFAPDGGNRHPDHIASHQIMMEALKNTDLLETGTRLYYFASPTLMNPDWADTFVPATHHRDVRDYLPQKLRAIAAHRTQALSTVGFLSRMAERIVTETFRRVHPVWDMNGHGSEL